MTVSTYEPSDAEGYPIFSDRLAPVRSWLALVAVLVFAMVLVGGATRLTESGLSITEWNPVVGAVPPLGEDAWRSEFDRYRQTSQYELLNRGMTLGEFKTIYWWEWSHRQLGRLIGLVYLAGFVWVATARRVNVGTGILLFGMGLLLAAQGFVGWIMVASGLKPGMTAVAPVKLTLHLSLACLFFASLVAGYVRLGGAVRDPASSGIRIASYGLVLAVLIQIALGGLVAGHDAGLTYNTWPLMDGRLVPGGLAALDPYWLNIVDNVTAIQFNHRIGAYALAIAAAAFAIYAWRRGSARSARRAAMIGAAVLIQMALGLLTLLHVVPLGLALAHQGAALILLALAVWNASVLRRA